MIWDAVVQFLLMAAATCFVVAALQPEIKQHSKDYHWRMVWAVVGGSFMAIACVYVVAMDAAHGPDPIRCQNEGGVQMALLDGEWKCIAADQAG